jgi:hypothetical protein
LCNVIEAIPAHLVTVVRDPYNALLSRYYWTQKREPTDREKAERRELERAVACRQSTADAAALLMRETKVALEESRRLRDMEKAMGPLRPDWGWYMEAWFVVHRSWQFPNAPEPIYYGHADTGYRISDRGKRSEMRYPSAAVQTFAPRYQRRS